MEIVLIVVNSIILLCLLIVQIFVLLRKTSSSAELSRDSLETIEKSVERIERSVKDEISKNRGEAGLELRNSREELSKSLSAFNKSLIGTMGEISNLQKGQLDLFAERLLSSFQEIGSNQRTQLSALLEQMTKLTDSNQQKLDLLKTAVEQKLAAIQDNNSKQLEQMRLTVDEKLQGTLEKRLGESFKLVSERLEQVYKGLGEMRTLASGVGDLKKVLTNVKTRGTWGEVQLGTMLEQILTPEQFSCNVATKGGAERVEFAIKLPGRSDDKDENVWLPIDAKFPIEDYQRLVEAQEKGDAEMTETAAKQLEIRIRQSAKDISEKYLNPPKTTDFGILFLPIEGLFAEVIRRPGLTDSLQRESRVIIAGPTTLWSILNSLQMGFRTLAIEKRSSEVWKLLAVAKSEWSKYGEVLDRVQKKLHEASNSIEDAKTRTRVIGRKLKDVQELPVSEADSILVLDSGNDTDEQG